MFEAGEIEAIERSASPAQAMPEVAALVSACSMKPLPTHRAPDDSDVRSANGHYLGALTLSSRETDKKYEVWDCVSLVTPVTTDWKKGAEFCHSGREKSRKSGLPKM